MDCEPLRTAWSVSCFFASLSWLLSVACGLAPVTLYICHALFYKVNKLGFLEESAVSERDAVVPGGL